MDGAIALLVITQAMGREKGEAFATVVVCLLRSFFFLANAVMLLVAWYCLMLEQA